MPQQRAPARSFRDLIVWQRSIELVKAIYDVARQLPRDEQHAFASQLKRAALSVASNIAEGWGRGGRTELRRFLTIARGSLYEVESLLDTIELLGFVAPASMLDARRLADEVGRLLTAFRASLRSTRRDS